MNDHLDFYHHLQVESRYEPCLSAQKDHQAKKQTDTSQEIGANNEGFSGSSPGSHENLGIS